MEVACQELSKIMETVGCPLVDLLSAVNPGGLFRNSIPNALVEVRTRCTWLTAYFNNSAADSILSLGEAVLRIAYGPPY